MFVQTPLESVMCAQSLEGTFGGGSLAFVEGSHSGLHLGGVELSEGPRVPAAADRLHGQPLELHTHTHTQSYTNNKYFIRSVHVS